VKVDLQKENKEEETIDKLKISAGTKTSRWTPNIVKHIDNSHIHALYIHGLRMILRQK
jgi:hypothetical protein